MTDTRAHVLEVMRAHAIREHALPSMDAVARESGLSKGGLLHHFPSRAALIGGFVDDLLRSAGDAMEQAAREGRAAHAWLEGSSPESDELDLYRVLYTAAQTPQALSESDRSTMVAFNDRVAELLTAELGDAERAFEIRMLGDGLYLNALTGTPVDPDERRRLMAKALREPALAG